MYSCLLSVVVAASTFTPQTDRIVPNESGTPKLELGLLSEPLQGDLVGAVKAWALSRKEHYGLQTPSTLKSTDAFSTRFGASFHLQQEVNGLEIYQSKLVVTLDDKRQVVQVASSLAAFGHVLDGERLTSDQALSKAAAELPLIALQPNGVPYGGAKRFYFVVGTDLHEGWLANVQSLDFSKNWYVAIDAVTRERLFVQNRMHHAALDANVYAISPGGLDAGVGVAPLLTRELRHPDGGSMIGDTCVLPQPDGGFPEAPNSRGELCGTQLMMYNCCPTEGCAPDAGAKHLAGSLSFMGVPVQYDVAVCDRLRRASNQTNPSGNYVYAPVDPPANTSAVIASDAANSDAFAEVHSFYHVNTVYDWVRKLSGKAAPIYGNNPNILPFKMRDERRTPAVKVAVWSNAMFPNFQELLSGGFGCLANPPCRANTLLRLDNAAFMPRENFAQLPLPGFDTGADTLMIFQGNSADAAYDATVIQHEFGHGAVYATANLTFSDLAIDSRSANNEGGALHEGFADYIAAAFNNSAEVGPYFGPRVIAAQGAVPGVPVDGYLRTMDNTLTCPSVLWGEVHQDAQHVAGAFWDARKTLFQGLDRGETFDAAFYAMLVSITPNADFAMVASTMAARVATAFPSVPMASAKMTQIFEARGVVGCSKILDASAHPLPRPYYGIASAGTSMANALIPGPLQFKVSAPAGAARIRVTATSGGGGALGGGGAAPQVQILTRVGSPITFTKEAATLQNDSTLSATMAASQSNLSGAADVNAPCNSDIYVTLATAGGGATLQRVNIQVDPLVNCMVAVDAGTGGGTGTGGGDSGTGGGMGGGNTGTTTTPSVGAGSTTQQPPAKTGCGCSGPADFGAPLAALMMLLAARRRR